jgi:hypothetical protein
MNKIVQTAFRNTVEFLRSEVELMPLSRWNESVLRYHFCRFLATDYPDVEQYVECDKIDLVLRQPPKVAFIEFKFYRHPRRHDPYDGRPRGYKGGPGRKNVAEFQACINQLHGRPSASDVSKYVILVCADPTDGSRPNCRFSHYYDDYHHPRDSVSLRRIECSVPFETTDTIVRAQLYEVA